MTTLYRAADPVAEQACMIKVASAKNGVGTPRGLGQTLERPNPRAALVPNPAC